MKYKKAIISFPEAVLRAVDKFSQVITNGNRSAFVTQAVREKMSRTKQKSQRDRLREAYRATAEDGLKITKEWEALDDELWRKLDERTKKNS